MTTTNPNHPSDRTGDGPLPLLSYDILLQDMGLDQILTTTVAEALVQETRDTPWSEVWKGFPTATDDDMSATHYRGGLADSPAKKYSMVIRGGRLEILYGWSGCRPLAVAGSRQAGLIGDAQTVRVRQRHDQETWPLAQRHLPPVHPNANCQPNRRSGYRHGTPPTFPQCILNKLHPTTVMIYELSLSELDPLEPLLLLSDGTDLAFLAWTASLSTHPPSPFLFIYY